MNVRSIRIAILIFVIGASTLNLIIAMRAHNNIGSACATSGNPYDAPIWGSKTCEQTAAAHRNENMRMLVHEVAILTLAGVAWFLVPKR